MRLQLSWEFSCPQVIAAEALGLKCGGTAQRNWFSQSSNFLLTGMKLCKTKAWIFCHV